MEVDSNDELEKFEYKQELSERLKMAVDFALPLDMMGFAIAIDGENGGYIYYVGELQSLERLLQGMLSKIKAERKAQDREDGGQMIGGIIRISDN